MKFCPDCDNILIPEKGNLFCRTCKNEFEPIILKGVLKSN